MKIKGTVGKSDLEGGYLTVSDGNKVWKLEGAADLKVGQSVEIDGHEASDMMGIGFGTPTFKVKSVKVL